MGAYLEADLIIRLFGISFCSISCGYCRSINSTILGNDESMASIVQLQPVEDGATCDDWTCQAGKPMQVGRQQLSYRILQKWIISVSISKNIHIEEMYQQWDMDGQSSRVVPKYTGHSRWKFSGLLYFPFFGEMVCDYAIHFRTPRTQKVKLVFFFLLQINFFFPPKIQ